LIYIEYRQKEKEERTVNRVITSFRENSLRSLTLAASTNLITGCLLVIAPLQSSAQQPQTVAGAGPSTKVVGAFVKLLAEDEAARGYTFSVPPKSSKHAGGINNTETYVFGRTGRPLSDSEKAAGVDEIFLARMPITFVAGGQAGVRSLSLDQVCGIFTGRYTNWKEVGGNDRGIVIITREPTEALFLQLKEDVPCMKEVIDTTFVLKKEDHVIDMLKTTELGRRAIGFGAARNFPEAIRLAVTGFDSGVKLGLVFRTSNKDHPLLRAARKVARSEQWEATLKEMGLGLP